MTRRSLAGLFFAGGLAFLASHATRGNDPTGDPETPVPPPMAVAVKGPKGMEDPDDPMKKYPDFKKLVKGAKVTDGLFTLHHKDENLYIEIREDQFNKPFLMPIAIAKGAGMGGTTLNFGEEWVLVFKKMGEKVFLIRRNVRFKANPDSPAARSVETTYSDSILKALPIKTMNQEKGTTVLDLNQIFFEDFAELGLGSFDASRTTWHKVKAFKKNVELQVAATYAGGGGMGMFGMMFGSDEIIDSRGISIIIQYGLVELPENNGYQPRLADNRVGHFLTVVKDFSKDDPNTSFVRMINRWRLERADGSEWKPGGKLVPPKKRIVFWIENSVPDEYRTAVRDGILEWNKAFEKIGFRDAIEVRQQEGEEFDPEDITYSTFRWTSQDTGGAIGPSRANPLTGELLDADILFDGGFIRYYKEEQRIFRDDRGRPVLPSSGIQAANRGWEIPVHPLSFRNSPFRWNTKAGPNQLTPEALAWQRRNSARIGYCQCASHKRAELALGMLAALPKDADGKLSDELIQQAVKEITMHEVGHTLGLRHNFKASTMLPNDKLHDTAITRKQGLVGSVMDYSPANIAPKGVKQGDFFTTTIGPYDYWVIEYAYRPLTGGTEGEIEELKKIASKVATPDLVYGTDEDLFGSPDPFINLWDMGADPIKFGKDRIAIANELFTTLTEKGVAPGEGYARLRRAFGLALGQYGDAAYLASRHVGGIVVNRDHKGDPNGRDPQIPVKADKQREALKFLQENILTDKPFNFPPELLRKLAVEKWYHWGTYGGFFGGGVDFPLYERILGIQDTALDELLSGGTLSRIQNSARSAAKEEKPLTVAEVFRALSDSVFADLPEADGKASAVKSSVILRNLQRSYLAKLIGIVLGPKDSGYGGMMIFFGPSMGGGDVPADARSLARFHLKEAVKRIDAALKAETDDTVKAHWDEAKERITKVLAAQVTTNEP